MKHCIYTNALYDEMPDYAYVSQRQKEKYAKTHHIDYIQTSLNPRPDSHPVWCKPILCAWLLQQYDWVTWIDVDAMPVNMEFSLPEYLENIKVPVVMGQDLNKWNTGVFSVRKDARDWLLEMDCRRSQYTRRFREQQCMGDSIDKGEIQCHIPPLEIGWNDYLPSLYNRKPYEHDENIYRKGKSWILHLPAVDDTRRFGILSREAYDDCKIYDTPTHRG